MRRRKQRHNENKKGHSSNNTRWKQRHMRRRKQRHNGNIHNETEQPQDIN
jgi:hypothetical protein